MDVKEKDGIAYLNKPETLDWLEFAFKHLGCDTITVDDEDGDLRKVTLVAYAVSEDKNLALEQVFRKNYNDGKHIIMSGISEVEAYGIV